MTVSFTDIAAFSQESIDSLVKVNTAATKGFETLSKYFIELTSKSFEDAVTNGKKFAAVKSPTELLQVQTKIFQDSFENLVDETKKVSEMTTSIFKDVSAPLAAQFKTAAPKAVAAMKKAA